MVNIRKKSAADLAHKPSDAELRKSKNTCNFGVMSNEQRYAIAAIMTLRKAEKRKYCDRNSLTDLNSLLNAENMQNSRQKGRRLTDSDFSHDDDRYERVVREQVSLNVQKYGVHCRDAASDHAKRRKNSSVERERSISSLLSSPTDRKLLSPIQKHKSLFENSSTKTINVFELDSDVDDLSKKKGRKKHKKHSSKKNRKHKKHKKKEKHASTVVSSSDDNNEDDDVVAIDDDSSLSTVDMNTDTSRYDRTSIGSNAIINLGANSINEDLERQLRERALKSMKKSN